MSFNRGARRNTFGNRNFGNRSGGGGGGGGHSGPGGVGMGDVGSSNNSNRGMNPWESGVMPGRGILPTPSNNLSLNSPQAQLVIASNLLSNLLRTQQDTQPQKISCEKVPSLLSLGNNNMNGPRSNFRGLQQGFNSNRFSERDRSNNPKMRNHPYKMGNRARDSVAGRRGPSAQQSRAQSQSGNQRINGNQNQHRNDKTSKANPASKQNQTGKKEQQDAKTSDNEKADTQPTAKSDEKIDKTSENKIEGDVKTETEETPMESTAGVAVKTEESAQEPEGDANANASSSAKKTDDSQSSGKKSEARHAESRYAAVPISHMFCHVCNKHMWDGFSFENHLRGRAHQLMMDKLDESYKLRVDFMRHELKVSEEQRELSLHNSKRRGKKVSVDLNVREYCTMCDLNFYGTLSSHRKSEKHQQLKIFLHPRCIACAKEFPSRIEYDEHCLTPAHMVNAAQTEEQKKSKKNKLAKGESEVRTAEDEEKDSVDPKANEKEEDLPDDAKYIVDIVEDMDMTKNKIPPFKHCRQNQLGVGASLVKQVQGYHCDKCRRFMVTEEDMNAHLRTLTHYRNFVAEVKALTTPAVADSTADVEKPQETSTQEETKPSDDTEPQAKRVKLETSETNSAAPDKIEEVTIVPEEKSSKSDGNEKYDPLEADVESEDDATQNAAAKEDNKDSGNTEQQMEVWGDGDNDHEPEMGNLLDDDDADVIVQSSKVAPAVAEEQSKIAPAANEPVKPVQAAEQAKNAQSASEQGPKPPAQVSNEPKNVSPSVNERQAAQLQSSITVEMNEMMKKNISGPPNNSMNMMQNKSPRGRGFRGRGNQRARRSRR